MAKKTRRDDRDRPIRRRQQKKSKYNSCASHTADDQGILMRNAVKPRRLRARCLVENLRGT